MFAGLLLVLGMICYYQAVKAGAFLKGAADYADLALRAPLTTSEVKDLLHRAEAAGTVQYPMIFLQGQEQIEVKSANAERSMAADMLAVIGDTTLLSTENIHLTEEDKYGCLLSEDVSNRLFGTGDSSGAQVTINGVDYTVRGVFGTLESTIVIPAGDDNELSRVRILVPEGQASGQVVNAVANTMGIAGALLEYKLLYWLAVIGLWWLPLTVAAGFLLWLGRNIRGTDYLGEKVIWWCLLALTIVVCGYFTGRMLHIPRELVPSKWSDFSFWSQMFEEKKDALNAVFAAAKMSFDRGYVGYFIRSTVLSIVAVVLYFLASICYTIRTKE